MAGAGVRVFQPGEVLSSTQVNTYLMDQAVCRFATETARDAAFGGSGQPTLSEGRVCYIDSLNIIQYYSGSSWVGISAEAITSVIQAKGDLVIGTALTTAGRVAVGTNGYFLTADSSTATGVTWTPSAVSDGTVTTAKLAPNAVTTEKIADGAVTLAKIAGATIDEKIASYTLALTDNNKFIKMNTLNVNTVIVPTNASVAFPIGSQINIVQYGSGKTQVIPVSGTVTIYATPGSYLRAQYSSATLVKFETNVWLLIGDLSAT